MHDARPLDTQSPCLVRVRVRGRVRVRVRVRVRLRLRVTAPREPIRP